MVCAFPSITMKAIHAQKTVAMSKRGHRPRSALVLPVLLALVGVTAVPNCAFDRCSATEAVDCGATSQPKSTMADGHCGQKGPSVALETSGCEETTGTCCGLTQGAPTPVLEEVAVAPPSPHQLSAPASSFRQDRLVERWPSLGERVPPDRSRPSLFLLHDALLI